METVASNFPGIFTAQGGGNYNRGLEGKDAVLIDVTTRSAQTATEGLRNQLLGENVLREGQEGIQATQRAECELMKEILTTRFEAKNNQRDIEDKVKLDGERTRDLIKAQESARLQDQIAELRAAVSRLTAVTAPVVR